MSDSRIILECPCCEERIEAEVIADRADWPSMYGETIEHRRLSFAECPSCYAVMLITQPLVQVPLGGEKAQEADWGAPSVLYWLSEVDGEGYPELERSLVSCPLKEAGGRIPEKVRKALEEAEKCLNIKAYGACASQCRKAIEAICHAKNCVGGSVGAKLAELCDRMIIDSKILDWARTVKVLGDRGAHAYRKSVDEEEARFALEFAAEVARYVFVLNEKYQRFKDRGKKEEKRPDTDEPDAPESPED